MLLDKPRIPIRQVLTIGLLPSFLKKLIYRLNGYRIGRHVKIGLGSVVCGKDVVIGDYSQIGFLTIVRGEKIRIGSHVKIGSTTFLDTPHLEIGDDSKINEQVFVGGLQDPDSKFILGKNCQIFQLSYINPAKSIVVGNDSAIGGHSLIFGHASWLNEFEGYPVNFAPIEIGNSVAISWRVFVLPGVKIGDGTLIGANSLVNRNIPSRCLASGFPIRIVSQESDFPKKITWDDRVSILEKITSEMAIYFRKSGLGCEKQENNIYLVTIDRKRWLRISREQWRLQILYSKEQQELTNLNGRPDVLVSLTEIPHEVRKKLNRLKIIWVDIEKKERTNLSNEIGEEVIHFLRRYGVRFSRISEK